MSKDGTPQTIEDILTHKDRRQALQEMLLQTYPNTSLIVLTLNIPGPIKNNQTFKYLFNEGRRAIKEKMNCEFLVERTIDRASGLDNFLIYDQELRSVKEKMMEIEEEHCLGRLFDIDVLALESGKLRQVSRVDLGKPARKCYICDEPAKVCSRHQTHSLESIYQCIDALYTQVRDLADDRDSK